MGKSGTELKNIKDELLVDIKSLLMASKAGLTELELKRDYEYTLGRQLPYIQLGFNSIYDMMMSWPQDVSVGRHGNVWVYYAIHDERTKDLARLVHGQLDKNKADRDRRRQNEGRRQQYQQSSRPFGNNGNVYSSSRYQFQSFTPRTNPATTLSTQVQPSTSGDSTKTMSSSGSSRVTPKLEKEIVHVLELNGSEMSLAKLEDEYLKVYGIRLNCNDYGFEQMIQMFESLPNLFYVKNATGASSDGKWVIGLVSRRSGQSSSSSVPPVEQLVRELRDLIYSLNTIELKRLPSTFELQYGHALDYKNYGYMSLSAFITTKLKNELKVSFHDDLNGYVVSSVHSSSSSSSSTSVSAPPRTDKNVSSQVVNKTLPVQIEKETTTPQPSSSQNKSVEKKNEERRRQEDTNHLNESPDNGGVSNAKLSDLVTEIEKALIVSGKSLLKTDFTVHDLLESYRHYHKRELDLAAYKLISVDQLLCRLRSLGRVRINESDNTFTFLTTSVETSPEVTSHFPSIIRKTTTAAGTTTVSKTNLFAVKSEDDAQKNKHDQLLAISETLLAKGEIVSMPADECLSKVEPMRQLATKADNKHVIVISQVQDPSFIQFQLYENSYELETLMNQLEHAYHGWGATLYDMPDEYKVNGRICVAIFPNDKNWHRARISQTFKKERRASVYFIDYGGHTLVDYADIKFIRRQFTLLPVQALDAKFANVKFTKNQNQGSESVMNYLLNRVMNKTLEARITGVINNNLFCLEIVDKCVHMSKAEINLNKRIIQDGFGTGIDDSKTPGFVDYETWKSQFLEQFATTTIVPAPEVLSSPNSVHAQSSQTTVTPIDSHSSRYLHQSSDSILDPSTPNKSNSLTSLTSREYLADARTDSNNNVHHNIGSSQSDQDDDESRDLPDILFRQLKIDFAYERPSVLFTQIKINDTIYYHMNDLVRVIGVGTRLIRKDQTRNQHYITRIRANQVNKHSFDHICKLLDLPIDDHIELIDQKYLLTLIEPWCTSDVYEMFKKKFEQAIKQYSYKPPPPPPQHQPPPTPAQLEEDTIRSLEALRARLHDQYSYYSLKHERDGDLESKKRAAEAYYELEKVKSKLSGTSFNNSTLLSEL